MSKKTLWVKYVKSSIGYSQRQKGTIRALGLKRLGDTVEVKDTDAIRGMLKKVEHLVQVEEIK
jgi:large subunit ribosomal protein L30